MDYERIEALSKKLHSARLDVRLRTASNLLFKLESGIFDKDAIAHSTCLTNLLEGVHKSLAFLLENPTELTDHSKEPYQLLQVLLSIVRLTVKDPSQSISLDVSSRILEQLYQFKNSGCTDGQADKFIEETINTLCGLNRSESSMRAAQFDLDQRIAHMASTINVNVTTEHLPIEANQRSRLQGAGAVLNSRLVYTGWKFPAFVLTERDERWLFDVEVKVKLQHERAARDLWDVLEDFPPQALLLKTNLLHSVLDLVGAPFSQADVDADPLGLHCLTALRWLDALLTKCRQAFKVQLDGSLCSRAPVPHDFHAHRRRSNESDGEGEKPDLAGKLAQAMYALRHPCLPTSTVASEEDDAVSAFRDALFQRHDEPPTPLAALSALFPGPSYPGLAFACCAASLPLLQSRDTTVARAVRSLLSAALPFVLEPRLQGSNDRLLEVEHGRLQHLLNRVEQLLGFFGETFDIDAFLALVSAEDDNLSDTAGQTGEPSTIEALQSTSFDLTVLSCVVELFRALPAEALLPVTQPDDGLEGKLAVGQLTQTCLCKIAATCTSLEALLPGCTEVAARCLGVVDGAVLGSIQAAWRTLETAQLYNQPPDRSRPPSDLLAEFLYSAEACASLLDRACPVPVPSVQLAIAGSLPILLQAAYQRADDEEEHSEAALQCACALVVRVLSCGGAPVKAVFLEHLLAWLTRSYELLTPGAIQQAGLFSEQQVHMIRHFNLHPASGRQVLSVLATPDVMHALLQCTTYSTKEEDGEVRGAAQEVVEALCACLLSKELSPEQVHAWSGLLLPLKVAEWEAEQAAESGATVGITAFARRLQDSCAESPSAGLQTEFARSLVMGLFHADSAVRINSALRVRRDLLQVPLPSGLMGEHGDEDSRFGVMSYDLFPAGGGVAGLKLAAWKFGVSPSGVALDGALKRNKTVRVPTSTTFTHADVRKIASIALGDLDASIRASAMGQLLDMLSSDLHLLRTTDAEWALSTVRGALAQLTHLAPFAESAESTAGKSLHCSPQRLQAMSDAECRLFVETARAVGFFFTQFAFLRRAVHFHAQAAPHSDYNAPVLNVSVLLKLLLSAHLQKKLPSSGYEALQHTACVCAQTLAVLTCSTESWPAPVTAAGPAAVSYKYAPRECDVAVSAQAVHIPAHIAARFLFPSSSASANEYAVKYSDKSAPAKTGKIAAAMSGVTTTTSVSGGGSAGGAGRAFSGVFEEVLLQCAPVQQVAYPPEDILVLVVAEMTARSTDTIKTLTATKLFGQVINARNHTHLRAALSSTLAVCQADPALLHAFVALRINLVTAVSHIITVNPRTQKDHITLASVLDFLTSVFASLRTTSSTVSSTSFLSEVVEWFADALSAVLPPLASYFADHFPQANTFFVGLSGQGRETEKEHATAAHAVCSAYFRLLHVLTSFAHPRVQLATTLTGHNVLALLVHISSSELHGSRDRAVALAILENVVSLHEGGFQALCCVENPESSVLGGKHPKPVTRVAQLTGRRNLAALAAEAEEFDPVECLVRVVRLVRTPDSLQSNATIVGALRLLYLCLLRRSRAATLSWTLGQSEEQWKWLVRLVYDRRSEVKVLAMEILAIVLRHISVDPQVHLFETTVDSLDEPAESDEGQDAHTEELISWPPFELLDHLAADSTESTALRIRAVEVLVSAHSDLPVLRHAVKKHFKLPVLMSALFECLSVRDADLAGAASMRAALSILTRLICARDEAFVQETLSVARSMKVTPLVVELLNVRLGSSLNVRALARVSVWDEEYIPRDRTTFFHGDALSLRVTAGTVYELQGAGWAALQSNHRTADTDALKDIRSGACWFFFHLRSADGGLFEDCVQHSTLLHYLATSFSAVAEPISPHSAFGFDFECGSVTAQAELLSLLISSEASTAATSTTATTGALHAYVLQNEAVPGNVLKKIILILLSVMEVEVTPTTSRGVSRRQQQLMCVSACLRLLAVMVEEAHWREGLGLGGAAEGSMMSSPCAYLFDLLLSLRKVLSTLSPDAAEHCDVTVDHSPETLITRIDLTVALFLQHSHEARARFVQHSVQAQLAAVESGRAAVPSEISIFKQHVDVISNAVEILNSPASATTSAPASSVSVSSGQSVAGSAGVISPEAKRSLQSLKAKTATSTTVSVSASASASGVKKGGAGGAVHQSTSSWATRSTTAGSKWRDKSRGYAWNKDKEAGATSNTASNANAVELPDGVKRKLWSALTVLSHALPGCEPAVDWAIDLQLHQSLSKLLRFAARYSIHTLVSSSTSTTAAHLAALSAQAQSHQEDPCWVPSNGMLASAVYALCCAFTHHHTHAKQCFAATGEAAAAVLGANNATGGVKGVSVQSKIQGGAPSGGGGTALHQLITLGTARSMTPVTRWLALGLAGSLLSIAKNAGSSSMKSTFSQLVTLSLQRSLHASHADPEAVVPLLTTLTCFLSSEEDLAHLTQLCRRDHAATLRALQQSLGLARDPGAKGTDPMADEFKLVTFPELLSWVQADHGQRAEVSVALCRCLGRISLVDKSHRTVGNLLSESMLRLLCEAYTSSHPLVGSTSALALWHIVHHSEKAKTIVREILSASPGSLSVRDKENEYMYENEGDVEGAVKAKYVIDSLRALV